MYELAHHIVVQVRVGSNGGDGVSSRGSSGAQSNNRHYS
jgi:hypothetical protein